MLPELLPGETTGDEDDNNVLGFAQIDKSGAIPADERSPDTVNFVKIIDNHINNSEDPIMTDDWGQTIAPGQAFIEGRYFLHQFSGHYESTYTQDQRKVFFFKESIVYPFVQHVQVKGGITISNNEKCDIINFVQASGMSSL